MPERQYLSALEAVHFLAPRVGGDKAAKWAIIERLKDGAIEAKAWWFAHGIDIGQPYIMPTMTVEVIEGQAGPTADNWKQFRIENSRPTVSEKKIGSGYAKTVKYLPKNSKSDLIIAQGFWSKMRDEDFESQDWSVGFFIIRFPSEEIFIDGKKKYLRHPTRSFVLGVEFDQNDILKIAGVNDDMNDQARSIISRKSSNSGRKRSEKWPAWVAEVVVYLLDEPMNLTANKLVDDVANRMAEKGLEGPGERTVFDTAAAIVDALVETRIKTDQK